MAEVTSSSRVEHWLQFERKSWSDLPCIVDEWDSWEAVDQEVFILEWAVKESGLAELADAHAKGGLSSEQHRDYQKILRLVDKHRPLLEKLMAS